MLSLLAFIFFLVSVVGAYLYGKQIGYLNGKQEVSHIPRGEPPEDSTTDILGSELQQIVSWVKAAERK